MTWLRAHPYAALAALFVVLLISGALFVESRTRTQSGALSVWGDTGAPLLNPTSYAPIAQTQSSNAAPQGKDYSPIYIPPTETVDSEQSATQSDFNYDVIIAQLSESGSKKPRVTSSSSGGSIAYEFIPTGLVATTAPVRTRTSEQEALYQYGTDAGSYIKTYEDSYRNAPHTLRDQAEDRQNVQKAQAVKLVAQALRTVGENLLGMEEIPSSIASEHKALAESYIDVGNKLAKVPDANGDEAFLSAVTAYNTAADIFVRAYVDLALVFSLNEVRFAPTDPGSVFSFTNGSGL